MRAGVEYALNRGVPIVASAGNRLAGGICEYADCRNSRIDDWNIIPAVWPDVICVAAASELEPYLNQHFWGDRIDVWAPIPYQYWAPPTTGTVTDHTNQSQTEIGGTSAAAPFVSGVVAMMQAVNPELNRHSRLDRAAQMREIPRTIRRLLIETATSAEDIRAHLMAEGRWNSSWDTNPDVEQRRNLVNAYAAVEAANAHWPNPSWIPDVRVAGFDLSLGFDEAADPSLAFDDANHALEWRVDQPQQLAGTILRIPRGPGPGGIDFHDEDWLRLVAPVGTVPFGGGRLILDVLPRDRYGDIRVNDQRGIYIGGRYIGLGGRSGTRTFFVDRYEYPIPAMWPRNSSDPIDQSNSILWPIRGFDNGDGVYRVILEAAAPASIGPDRFDHLTRNDRSGDATLLGGSEGITGENQIATDFDGDETSWREPKVTFGGGIPGEDRKREILLQDLSFHTRDDEDWFELHLPEWAAQCGDCAATLQVHIEGEDAANIQVTVIGADGTEIERKLGGTIPCRNYAGRLPLRIRVQNTGIGPGRYQLRFSLSQPSFQLCHVLRRIEDYALDGTWRRPGLRPDATATPLTLTNLRGSTWLEFPHRSDLAIDPSRTAEMTLTRPEVLVLQWAGDGPFVLEAEATGGPSLSVQLFDPAARPIALAGTEDVLRAALDRSAMGDPAIARPAQLFPAKRISEGAVLTMGFPELPAGAYFISLGAAKPGTRVFLALPRGAVHDGSVALEDLSPPRTPTIKETVLDRNDPDALASFPEQLGAGERSPAWETPPRSESQLRVRVFAAGGAEPITKAEIVVQTDDQIALSGDSNADGKFDGLLSVGRYQMIVTRNGYYPAKSTLVASADFITHDVYLTPLAVERPFEPESETGQLVHGFVVGRPDRNAKYAALENAEILWIPQAGGPAVTGRSDHRGAFQVRVSPGIYRVVGRADNYVSHAEEVTVADEMLRVVMRLERVADPDGGLSDGLTEVPVTTPAEVKLPHVGDRIKPVDAGPQPEPPDPPGPQSAGPRVELPITNPSSLVRGHVLVNSATVRGGYAAVDGAQIEWIRGKGQPVAVSRSDRGGRFQVTLPTGDYQARIRAPLGYLDRSFVIRVTPTTGVQQFVLKRDLSVRPEAPSLNSQPGLSSRRAPITIMVGAMPPGQERPVPLVGAVVSFTGRDRKRVERHTSVNGAATLELAPGTYHVVVSHDGYHSQQALAWIPIRGVRLNKSEGNGRFCLFLGKSL